MAKKNDNCCGKTVTETTSTTTKYGMAACEPERGTLQYIGARYVPVFADPVEWDNTRTYEHLMMVQHQGNTYISKQAVPVGIDIPSETGENDYWILFSNWSAQIAEFQSELREFSSELDSKAEVDVTPIDDLKNNVSLLIPNYYDRDGVQANNIVRVTNDGTLANAIAATGMMYLADGHLDLANAITTMNTYLANQDKFVYDQSYNGIMYGGEYSNPVAVNPSEHLTDGKFHIDCNTFTQLCGHGVTYQNSRYGRGDNINIAMHPMFDPLSENVKPYWFYNIENASEATKARPTGYGRVLGSAFAKMLYDAGKLQKVDNVIGITPGAIMFNGNLDDTFLGIGHCYFVGGFIGSDIADCIAVEAIGGYDEGGIVTRQLRTVNALNTKCQYIPPWTSGARMSASPLYRKYCYLHENIAINETPHVWTPSDAALGARVLTLVTRKSAAFPLNIVAENTVNNERIEKTVSVIGGSYIIYLPLNWKVTLTSTSANKVNIVWNICTSDNQITFAPDTAND